ncbi:MAG: 5'-nucleotidase C-terminal domain-containing protein [Thiothrix sp.]|uniref:bifunctional metallophosphatase/5'-nucleotidase n=1 Tax=Thiothrix sp. TaxID=1032 RepID=UPI002613E81C|nr:5'-nucleotidase C-terminal domain-containing protein [Thiothrix sp.]MDD5394615.1 5'-nucleotidase C-terminal domain-containing protein [Thiothrix sp.]
MKRLLALLLITSCITACAWLPGQAQETPAPNPITKRASILVINDIYRLDNLPYVRSLRAALEEKEGDVLLLHAGDFLFPSLLSQRYDGEQMVNVLSYLDGDGKAFDERMFITFGNHEFEKGKLKHAEMLQKRITESQFAWLGTNVEFREISPGRRMVQADNLLPSKILTVNGMKVGIVSATTDVKGADYIQRFIPPQEAVRNVTRELRKQGAEVVIAVTHQTVQEDKDLLTALGDDAPDLIAGGHEHERQSLQVNGRRIVKADADAVSATIVRLSVTGSKLPQASLEFVDLPGKYAADSTVQQQVTHWENRFGQEYCAEKNAPADCLASVLGKTQVELKAEELTIRRFETNIGDWLVDIAREQFAAQGAQVAFLNSGGMRLNQNIPAGDITRKHIDTLFGYPARLVMLKLTGKQLQAVVDRSIQAWTGNGHWLQISGFAFRHNPDKGTAEDLSLITPQGLRPVKPDETIYAVTGDYLIDSSGDQDGYTMLSDKLIVDPAQPRIELKDQVVKALQQAGSTGIAPKVEGRICNTAVKGSPCLLD